MHTTTKGRRLDRWNRQAGSFGLKDNLELQILADMLHGRFLSQAMASVEQLPMKTRQLLTMGDLRRSIIEEYNKTRVSSRYTLQTLPKLSSMIQGLREHELSLYSGPTGAGKTTLLSQISLDYALQGVRTLWCSFEVKNSRLAIIMLEQLSQKNLQSSELPLEENRDFQWAVEHLSAYPIYFLDCFGKYEAIEFMDCLKATVAQYHIQHIIIDNLQFMLSNSWRGSLDKFDVFDRTISSFRAFCNAFPTHLSLIVHPRKEDDNLPLGLSSISGTAKATQEADNVIIIQRLDNKIFIDVKKNRHNGILGRIPVEFDQKAKALKEVSTIDTQKVD
jgi:twinkle protein